MTKCAQKSPTPGSDRHHARVAALVPSAIAVALAVTLVAQPAAGLPSQQPIEGWPMAKWGMTEPEVLKAFGGAAKSLTEEASRQSSDRTATIVIDDVAVGGVSFRALFLFDPTAALQQIRLELPPSSSPPATQFRKVEDYLAPKYGQPFRGTAANDVLSVWILQRSVIELHYAPTKLSLRFERLTGQTKESVMGGFVEIQGKPSLGGDHTVATSPAKSPKRVDPVSVAQSGKWRLIKSESQFDDSRTVVLTLVAENSIKGWLATSMPQLILRCQEHRTEAYVVTGMPATVEYGESDRHTVRLRYGDDAATSVMMSQSTDNKSLFFPDPTNSILRMWNVQTLLVGFTPFNANPVSIRFDVSGLPFAIQPLREACGW